MSDTPRVVQENVQLAGGTGYFDFDAQGTIDTAWLEPLSADVGAQFDYNIKDLATGAGRWANATMVGPSLDPVNRSVLGRQRLTILNCDHPTALFKVVLNVKAAI